MISIGYWENKRTVGIMGGYRHVGVPINQGYRYLGGGRKLTLITELCSANIEPLFYVSRGKIGEGDNREEGLLEPLRDVVSVRGGFVRQV